MSQETMTQAKWFENTLLLPQCDKIRTKKEDKKRGQATFLEGKRGLSPFFVFALFSPFFALFFLSPFFLVFSCISFT